MNNNALQHSHQFHTREENREIALDMVRSAGRTIDIFSVYLDPEIYSRDEFVHAFTKFCTASQHCKVRLLIQDSSTLIKNGHKMIEVIRHFTSVIAFRRPAAEHSELHHSCLIVDDSSVLLKNDATQFHGQYFYQDRVIANRQSESFLSIWERAEADPELRQLYL